MECEQCGESCEKLTRKQDPASGPFDLCGWLINPIEVCAGCAAEIDEMFRQELDATSEAFLG
jgi:hypothetical protein